MAIYKLLEDVGDAAFALIAIHSQEEDYRLAYQINAAIATLFLIDSIVVENHQHIDLMFMNGKNNIWNIHGISLLISQ